MAIYRTSHPASYSEVQHWNLDTETGFPASIVSWISSFPQGKCLDAVWNYATTLYFSM